MKLTAELNNCPVCGRKPKIKVELQNSGAFITLRCRKRFGKNKHNLSTWAGAASPYWCYKKVADHWNNVVTKEGVQC